MSKPRIKRYFIPCFQCWGWEVTDGSTSACAKTIPRAWATWRFAITVER